MSRANSQLSRPADPNYEAGAAHWHCTLVATLWDITITIDPHLIDPAALHPDGALWLRPGLPAATLHWVLAQATLYFGYGPDSVDTIPTPKGPRLIPPPR